jgi:hypothetical protein
MASPARRFRIAEADPRRPRPLPLPRPAHPTKTRSVGAKSRRSGALNPLTSLLHAQRQRTDHCYRRVRHPRCHSSEGRTSPAAATAARPHYSLCGKGSCRSGRRQTDASDDLRVRRPDALWLLQPEKSSGDLVVGDDRCRSSNPIASGASIEQHRPLNSSRRGSLGPPIRPVVQAGRGRPDPDAARLLAGAAGCPSEAAWASHRAGPARHSPAPAASPVIPS